MKKMNKQIYEYVSPECKTPVCDFISTLDCEVQEKIMTCLGYLKLCDRNKLPPMITNVCYDEFKYLYELRTRVKYAGVGILFCYDDFDNIVLLHAFYKYQEIPSKRALSIARGHRSDIRQGMAHTILFSIN